MPRVPYLVWLCFLGGMRSVESGDNTIFLKAYPRTISLDHAATSSYQQRFNAPPFKRCRNGFGKYGGECFAMCSVHADMVSIIDTMSSFCGRMKAFIRGTAPQLPAPTSSPSSCRINRAFSATPTRHRHHPHSAELRRKPARGYVESASCGCVPSVSRPVLRCAIPCRVSR